MRKLTEEEKRKLKEKIQEASAERTDRILEMARQVAENDAKLVGDLRYGGFGWAFRSHGRSDIRGRSYIMCWVTCLVPPLGIITAIILLAKGYKLVGACVLAGSIGIFLLYALGILR